MQLRKRLNVFVLSFLLVFGTWVVTPSTPPVQALNLNKQIIIKLSPGVSIGTITSRFGLTLVDQLVDKQEYLVETPLLSNINVLISLISAVPGVENAGPNLLIWPHRRPQSYDGDTPQVLGTAATTYQNQTLISFLQLGAVQGVSQGGNIKVAVVDTGADLAHPALVTRLTNDGYDYVDRDTVPADVTGGSASGHGTFVAGLVALLAPQAKIQPIRVLRPDGSGDAFHVAAGIYYAADHGAQVINLSLGTDRDTGMMSRSVTYAQNRGAIVVAAMGNDNLDASDVYPAAYANVIGVAATNFTDQKASFSNYGGLVDVCAPGVSLVSAYPQGAYASWSGTSFAAPLVSAEAALLLAQGKTVSLTTENIFRAVQPVVSSDKGWLGSGRIDLLAAVNQQ
ncbi:MAG: S8 family serine peptidase [Blastocatellia bacterium]|nr:S8 family serine peptidase [Blastocatellia bacterium]